jgi:hypothetical protein
MDFTKKIMDSILGKLPDMNNMMVGYEFKDGNLKPQIDYKMHGDVDIATVNGCVLLHASEDTFIGDTPTLLLTDLSLSIKPPNMIFLAILTDHRLSGTMAEIITSGDTYRVSFMVPSINRVFVKKGSVLGYGVFIPCIPTNNISLNKI